MFGGTWDALVARLSTRIEQAAGAEARLDVEAEGQEGEGGAPSAGKVTYPSQGSFKGSEMIDMRWAWQRGAY